jgi:hypothetical protein
MRIWSLSNTNEPKLFPQLAPRVRQEKYRRLWSEIYFVAKRCGRHRLAAHMETVDARGRSLSDRFVVGDSHLMLYFRSRVQLFGTEQDLLCAAILHLFVFSAIESESRSYPCRFHSWIEPSSKAKDRKRAGVCVFSLLVQTTCQARGQTRVRWADEEGDGCKLYPFWSSIRSGVIRVIDSSIMLKGSGSFGALGISRTRGKIGNGARSVEGLQVVAGNVSAPAVEEARAVSGGGMLVSRSTWQ